MVTLDYTKAHPVEFRETSFLGQALLQDSHNQRAFKHAPLAIAINNVSKQINRRSVIFRIAHNPVKDGDETVKVTMRIAQQINWRVISAASETSVPYGQASAIHRRVKRKSMTRKPVIVRQRLLGYGHFVFAKPYLERVKPR